MTTLLTYIGYFLFFCGIASTIAIIMSIFWGIFIYNYDKTFDKDDMY